jgi:hypothetical protein
MYNRLPYYPERGEKRDYSGCIAIDRELSVIITQLSLGVKRRSYHTSHYK